MSIETLFASDEVEAVYLPGNEAFLLITFAALDFVTSVDAFWGRHFAQKAGFSAIGFVPRRNNWYPQADMAAATRALAPVLDRFAARVSYGSSMGGYGAVKYGKLLGCTATVAFGPQVSIDPADGVTAAAYTKFFDPALHAEMAIGANDVSPNAFIFYDPCESFDKMNAATIARVAPHLHRIELPHAGHECIKVVAGLENTSSLLRSCLAGEAASVQAMCRRLRSTSPARKAGLAGTLVRRRPDVAFRIVQRWKDTFDRKQLALFYDSAAEAYALNGDFSKAEANSIAAIELLPNRTSFLRRLGQLYERAGRLEEALHWYNRYLYVNPVDPALLNAAAGVNLALRKLDDADRTACQALAIAPTNVNIVRRMSQIRVAQGRIPEAISILVKGANANASNPNVFLDISTLMSTQNETAEALRNARIALRLEPGSKAAKERVAALEITR